MYSPSQNHKYADLPPASLEQFHRASWGAVSRTAILILPQIKLVQLSCCTFWSTNICKTYFQMFDNRDLELCIINQKTIWLVYISVLFVHVTLYTSSWFVPDEMFLVTQQGLDSPNFSELKNVCYIVMKQSSKSQAIRNDKARTITVMSLATNIMFTYHT